jgi:hypothetical protein
MSAMTIMERAEKRAQAALVEAMGPAAIDPALVALLLQALQLLLNYCMRSESPARMKRLLIDRPILARLRARQAVAKAGVEGRAEVEAMTTALLAVAKESTEDEIAAFQHHLFIV